MKQVLIIGCVTLIFITLHSCISRNQYERLQSSKDRLSKSLVYTEKELTSLRERTYEMIDKFEKSSQDINYLNIRVNSLTELIRLDSIELVKYKLNLTDYQKQLRLCEQNSTLIATINDDKIKNLTKQYNSKIRALNNKLRKERFLHTQLIYKIQKDHDLNPRSFSR